MIEGIFKIIVLYSKRAILLTFVSTILLIFITFLIPVIITFGIYRYIVSCVAQLWRPELESFVTGMDTLFTSTDPKNAFANIVICFVLRGKLTPERISKLFEGRILSVRNENLEELFYYQKLQQVYTDFLGYSFWKRGPNFLIGNHIRYYDYTEEFGAPKDEDSLERILPKLTEAPWKPEQSRWEILIEKDYSKSGSSQNLEDEHSLMIVRFDHAICDGFSLIEIFRRISDSPLLLPTQFRARESESFNIEKLIKTLLRIVDDLSLKLHRWIVKRKNSRKNSQNMNITTKPSDLSFTFSSNVSVYFVKKIKNKYGVSFHSVLCSAVVGAIGRADFCAGDDSLNEIHFGFAIPLPNRPDDFGNYLGTADVNLPNKAKSSKERLQQIHDVISKAQQGYLLPLLFPYLFQLMTILPIPLVRHLTKLNTTMVMMSTVGSTLSPENMDGKEIVDVFTLVTFRPFYRIGVISWGVNCQQKFYFIVDKTLFKNEDLADKMAKLFLQELQNLYDS